MKSQAIRSVLATLGLAGAMLGVVHVAQGANFSLLAPGSQTKTDSTSSGHSVTATETLTATGATLNITANVGLYASSQTTGFGHSSSASIWKSNNANTTDGDIVQLAPPGDTAVRVQASILSNF